MVRPRGALGWPFLYHTTIYLGSPLVYRSSNLFISNLFALHSRKDLHLLPHPDSIYFSRSTFRPFTLLKYPQYHNINKQKSQPSISLSPPLNLLLSSKTSKQSRPSHQNLFPITSNPPLSPKTSIRSRGRSKTMTTTSTSSFLSSSPSSPHHNDPSPLLVLTIELVALVVVLGLVVAFGRFLPIDIAQYYNNSNNNRNYSVRPSIFTLHPLQEVTSVPQEASTTDDNNATTTDEANQQPQQRPSRPFLNEISSIPQEAPPPTIITRPLPTKTKNHNSQTTRPRELPWEDPS